MQTSLSRLLQSDQSLPAKELMRRLIGDVSSVSTEFYLVLDDYHRLDSAAIEAALALLIDYMPPQMTLVMTSRSDPGFPISRLRARREIVEIRADDLRFTAGEAAEFFKQTMGLMLNPSQITLLEEKTEGWIECIRFSIDGTWHIDHWLNQADQLPKEMIEQRPVLHVGYAWALLENGHLDRCMLELDVAEKNLADLSFQPIIEDKAQWETLPACIADARAYLALATGDSDGATACAQQGLDFFNQHTHLSRDHHWRRVALTLHVLTYFDADLLPPSIPSPLSEREQEILELIASGLKNKEIADQLFISLNTVLYHTKNIYGKLGVSKRTQAVIKARRLGLL